MAADADRVLNPPARAGKATHSPMLSMTFCVPLTEGPTISAMGSLTIRGLATTAAQWMTCAPETRKGQGRKGKGEMEGRQPPGGRRG